jgi:hypothetical protein
MKTSHHSSPQHADLEAIIAGGGAAVEIVETPETDLNNFNEFNTTPPERIHPIPENSILANFLDIAREVSEAPDSFAIAPFLALIGGVLTPRCWWDFAGRKHCNLYQFVVGPPGIRKSTSFKLAEQIGKEALSPDSFHSGNASDSAAFGKWKKQPHRIWLESEGNVTVQSWRGSHAGREIAARMLKLYDGDSWEQTYRHQEDKDGDAMAAHEKEERLEQNNDTGLSSDDNSDDNDDIAWLEEEEKSAISDGMKALALFFDPKHRTVEGRGDVVCGNNNNGDHDDYDCFSLMSNKFSFMNSKYYH